VAGVARRLLAVSAALVLAASAAVAEAEDGNPTPRAGWRTLTPMDRVAWIGGFLSGLRVGTEWVDELSDFTALKKMRPDQRVRFEATLNAPIATLVELVTAFYDDPANEYVGWQQSVVLSLSRQRGEPIEPQLNDARRRGLATWMKGSEAP
jgi:hypothetical protein